MVKWLFSTLERFTGISALPPQVMTYTVVGIWIAGAAGFAPAARWWHENATATTVFVQMSIGLWFAYRAGGWITTAVTGGSNAPAAQAPNPRT